MKSENHDSGYSDLVDFLDKQFDRVNYWLSFAELKNGTLLALNIAIIGVLMDKTKDFTILFSVILLSVVFSCLLCLASFIPNLTSKTINSPSGNYGNLNLLFFDDINKIATATEYIDLVNKYYFDDRYSKLYNKQVEDIASEIKINSKITSQKYKLFKYAMYVDVFAILFIVLSVLIA